MAEAAAKEPSMEDILSSIRKIIADEGDADGDSVANPQSASAEAPESPVDTMQEPVEAASAAVPEMPADPVRSSDSAHHVPVERELEPEVAIDPQESGNSLASIAASLQAAAPVSEDVTIEEPVVEVFEPVETAPVEPEIADVANEMEVNSEALSRVSMEEATPPPELSSNDVEKDEEAFRGALMSPSADNAVSSSFDRLKRSAMDDIEAKTEAILRPMLREWLDENLPTLVEKMVREEIERVARG